EGAAGLDEGHGLAFVVAGAARHDDLAPAGQRLDARLERRRLPLAQRVDRLHVVMTVEQHARASCAVGLADDDRMALGRPHLGVETDGPEVGGDVLGRGPTLRLVGRIGRHRGDAQQREQTLEALIEILVDAVEDRVECAHGRCSFGDAATVATWRRGEKRAENEESGTCAADRVDFSSFAGWTPDGWRGAQPAMRRTARTLTGARESARAENIFRARGATPCLSSARTCA